MIDTSRPGVPGPYGPQALPYGVFSRNGGAPRVGVRLSDDVVDLTVMAEHLEPDLGAFLDQPGLEALFAEGRATWRRVREAARRWVTSSEHEAPRKAASYPLDAIELHQPFAVADFVDYFSSRDHAENMSGILRPGQPPLQPNWLRIPVAYHGRAGSIVPSGTPVRRPWGVLPATGEGEPEFGATGRLDVEVELGFVVGTGSEPGNRIDVTAFEDHVFGVVMVNDWSARDIQAFEYVPLGPFLGKSFATSVGSWVLPLDALQGSRIAPPQRVHAVADYLTSVSDWGLDISFSLTLNDTVVSQPWFGTMYWTPDQQLAHMTANGASTRTGDLYASGTVSGADRATYGSLIELTHNGTSPLVLEDGSTRTFLEDGDEVVIEAFARTRDGQSVGLGDVRGRVVPWGTSTTSEGLTR